jgi:5-formyltetrahydrofolate cyclo-ligase
VHGGKKVMRKALLALRDSLQREIRTAKDRHIRDRLTGLEEFRKARTVLLYASFRSEVDTFGLMRESLSSGKRTVLPKVDREARDLMLFAIADPSELRPGFLGIPEPAMRETNRVGLTDIDLIVVPGAAFDEYCNRIGYGGGYYDKLLSRKRSPAVALCYDEQIVPLIEAEAHDIRVDKIVTDTRIIDCHGSA